MAGPTVAELLGDGVARSMRRYFDEEPHLLANGMHGVGGEGTYDPEFVHHARTSIRRLRAVLKATRRYSKPRSRCTIDTARKDLQWWGGLLGAVRDADVAEQLVSEFTGRQGADTSCHGAARQLFQPAHTEAIDRILAVQRRSAGERMAEAFGTPRYREVHEGLVRLTYTIAFRPAGHRSGAIEMPRRVGREHSRLEKLVARADSLPSSLHAVRIQAKRCRYLAELAVRCSRKPAARYVENMSALQDALGRHHDLTVLAETLQRDPSIAAIPVAAVLAEAALAEATQISTSWRDVWTTCQSRRATRWLG